MEDCVDRTIDIDKVGDVLLDIQKTVLPCQVSNVVGRACQQVVHSDDVVTTRQKTITQVRSNKTCSTGNQNPHICSLVSRKICGCRPLVCTAPGQDRWERQEQDTNIQRQRPVLCIVDIEAHHFLKRRI